MPSGHSRRVQFNVPLLRAICLSCLKGPTAQWALFAVKPANLFLNYFGIVFPGFIFAYFWVQNDSKWDHQNSPKSEKSIQTHHQNIPTVKSCKRTLSGTVQRKLTVAYTCSCFFNGSGLPKEKQNWRQFLELRWTFAHETKMLQWINTKTKFDECWLTRTNADELWRNSDEL